MKEERIWEVTHVDEKNEGEVSQEEGVEVRETGEEDDDDDTLISLDASPQHVPTGTHPPTEDSTADLLGGSPPKMENSLTSNLNPSTSAVIQGKAVFTR